jgi:hypothetical protein
MNTKITYAEKNKKKPFDWNAFLKKAIAGSITSREKSKAYMLACSWVTCACGNQCAIIPRWAMSGIEGAPIDSKLYYLGRHFMFEIGDEQYDTAKATLKKIERRSACLIKKILAKKKA